MRICNPIQALAVAGAMALFAGCSSNATIAPKPSIAHGQRFSIMDRAPIALSPMGLLKVNLNPGRRYSGSHPCPAVGTLVYISDYQNNTINIYTVPFRRQGPCGQLTTSLDHPQGLFVKNHDLYVANTQPGNIQVFHRGATTPYNTYTDPGLQFPMDVTVAKDGTVIASNFRQKLGKEQGSISTWRAGPHGGTFVGAFPMTNDLEGLFVTVQKDGTLYFNDLDGPNNDGHLWTGKCPLGACGTFIQTTGATLFAGGLRSVDDEDVVQIDQLAGSLITYESFSNFTSCTLSNASNPVTEDINRTQHHVFVADSGLNSGMEYTYPGCVFIGAVPGNPNGIPIGIATDYPESL